jgi:hypothetical protein
MLSKNGIDRACPAFPMQNLPFVKRRCRHAAFSRFMLFSGLVRVRTFHVVDHGTGLPKTNISFVALPELEGLSFSAFLHGV